MSFEGEHRKIIFAQFLILALVAVLLMAGCTAQSSTSTNTTVVSNKSTNTPAPAAFTPPLKETLQSHNSYDVDGDNVTDTYVYTYAPVKIKSANVEIQRIVIVGVYSTSLKNVQLKARPEKIEQQREFQMWFKTQTNNLMQQAISAQDSCSANIGLSTFTLCSKDSDCGSACSANGPAFCQKNTNSQLSVGFWILQYVTSIKDLNKKFTAVSGNAANIGSFWLNQQEDLINLNNVLDDIDQIRSNPIMFNNIFGLCSPINYNPKKILHLMNELAVFHREPTLYRYAVIIKVKSLGGSDVPVSIVDQLPPKLLDSLQLLDGPQGLINYNNINGTVSESNIPVSPQQPYYVTYYFTSPIPPNREMMAQWRTPEVSSFSTLLQNKTKGLMGLVMNAFIDAVDVPYHLFSRVFGPHVSLGLSIGIYTFIALSLLFIFNLTLILLLAVANNKDPLKELKVNWGVPFTGWVWYIPIAILCVLIAFILQYLSGAQSVSHLTFLTLPKIVSNLVGDVAIFLIFMASCLTFFGVESAVKTVIVPHVRKQSIPGQKPVSVRRANAVKLSTLKEDVLTLSALIKKNKSVVDITEEEQYLETLPLEKLENLVNSDADPAETSRLLDRYLDKTEEAIKNLKEKVVITNEYWPKWEEYIESMLKSRKIVPLSQLTHIPQKWRLWAVNRYINERAIGKYIVENNAVKRIVVSNVKEAKEVEQLSKEKSVSGTVLFKNGKLTASFARRGNSTVLAILLQRIDMYVSDILRTIYKSPYYDAVVFYSKTKKVVIKKNENNLLVLWGSRSEIEKKIDEVKKKGKF